MFECLAAELGTRASVLRQHGPSSPDAAAYQQLARLFQYVSFRFTELILRLDQLNWMQQAFATKAGEDSTPWSNFAALTIKDFHIDLASLMDAVAPTVLQVARAFNAEGEERLPGFADIQLSGSKRSAGFRASLSPGLLAIVDSTDRWWPAVKAVRDTLAHREHQKIVFGGAAMGVLFQVYTPPGAPTILDPNLLWPGGTNVADFRRYSSAVLAELLLFLDELGSALAAELRLSIGGLTKSMRVGDFGYLVEPMEQLQSVISPGG